MLKNIKDFICMHLNFKVYNVTIAAIIAALAIAPCVMFLPESYGFENGVLENLQLIVLFLGFIFALMAKDNKKFFYFVAMIIAVLAIREVNCFRTVFLQYPGKSMNFIPGIRLNLAGFIIRFTGCLLHMLLFIS